MNHRIVYAAACAVFLVRDTRLIVDQPRLFWPYSPILILTVVVCALVAELVSPESVDGLGRELRFCIFALLMHGLQAFRAFQRSRRGVTPDWRSFMPGPMVCVALDRCVAFRFYAIRRQHGADSRPGHRSGVPSAAWGGSSCTGSNPSSDACQPVSFCCRLAPGVVASSPGSRAARCAARSVDG